MPKRGSSRFDARLMEIGRFGKVVEGVNVDAAVLSLAGSRGASNALGARGMTKLGFRSALEAVWRSVGVGVAVGGDPQFRRSESIRGEGASVSGASLPALGSMLGERVVISSMAALSGELDARVASVCRCAACVASNTGADADAGN